jgi:hypothetical protein
MNFHYLIISRSPVLWRVLHSPNPIAHEEVQTWLALGSYDVVDISDPENPKSMVINQDARN